MVHLPDKIYRHLPDLYIVVGIYVLLVLDHPIRIFSGILLVVTGLFVFHFRLKQRDVEIESDELDS